MDGYVLSPGRLLIGGVAADHPVAELFVDADHVVVGLGVPGVDLVQGRLGLPHPLQHAGLDQYTEPVAAVRPVDCRVVLVAEVGTFSLHHDGAVTGQRAGGALPGDHAVDGPV